MACMNTLVSVVSSKQPTLFVRMNTSLQYILMDGFDATEPVSPGNDKCQLYSKNNYYLLCSFQPLSLMSQIQKEWGAAEKYP